MNWPWRRPAAEEQRLRAELAAAQARLERVVDNALFAAGSTPIFHPEDHRFQPRPVEIQQPEAARLKPSLSAGEWRRRIEAAEAERSARDRKAHLVEQLRREATARKAQESIHAER